MNPTNANTRSPNDPATPAPAAFASFRLKDPCKDGEMMLVPNSKKFRQGANPKLPDFVGELTLGGVRHSVALWSNLSRKGSRLLRGKVAVLTFNRPEAPYGDIPPTPGQAPGTPYGDFPPIPEPDPDRDQDQAYPSRPPF